MVHCEKGILLKKKMLVTNPLQWHRHRSPPDRRLPGVFRQHQPILAAPPLPLHPPTPGILLRDFRPQDQAELQRGEVDHLRDSLCHTHFRGMVDR